MGTTESSLGAPPPSRQPTSPQTQSPTGSRPRPIRRPRPGPVLTLNGLVLGLRGSGKRTLLQRLEGKDPFAVATDGSNNGQHDDEDSPRGITVPYQPPQKATIWDRIQLHVELTPNKDVAADFSVILINPRHDAKSLQPYISRLVSMLIQQRERNQPLCLCFLLNFRDLQGDRYARIQCDTVEKWAREIVKQHDVNENLVVLQCTTTSLKNCYGLSTLHHFIYRSYLVHKEIELKQRLSEVRHLLNESQEVPSMTYDAFLKAVAQTSKASFGEQQGLTSSTGGSSREQMHEGRERDGRKNTSNNVNEEKKQQALDGKRQQPSTDSRKHNEPESLRSILPKTYGDPKRSLDAFFADDDDEEEGIVTPVTSHHARDRILHSSDSDEDEDEDDDFFYDEGGHRHQHGTVVMDSLSDQEDEASVESQIAHARDHSILDSEDSDLNESEELDVGAGVSAPVVDDQQPRNMTISDTSSDGGSNKEEVVKGGWDDEDDIDFDDDDEARNAGEATDNKDEGNDDRQQAVEQAVGSDEADADGDGWGDDNDIDLDVDAESETQPPSSLEENVSADGTNSSSEGTKEAPVDKEQVANGQKSKLPGVQAESSPDEEVPTIQESPSSEQVTPDIASTDTTEPEVDKPTEPSLVPVSKNPPSQTEQDESSDDDDFMVEETEPTTEGQAHVKVSVDESSADSADAKKPASPRPIRRQDENDDDENFVVETAAPSSTPVPTPHNTHPKPLEVVDKESVPEESSSQPSSSGTGISAAALAAIAAAEKEAARMMQDATKDAPLVPSKVEKKKSKKKKDPDVKKKKKKHKQEGISSGSKRTTKESS